MPDPTVVSVTPIRSRAWMVRRHAEALRTQTRPLDAILYVTGDNEDETEELLATRDGVTAFYFDTGSPHWTRDREGARYTGDQHASLARVYNRCLETALEVEPKATHVWLLDSDVVPDPDALELLLAADKDLVAAVVWNSPGALNFMCGWPAVGGDNREVWREGREATRLDAQAPFVVPFLSACTLIRREVLETAVGPVSASGRAPGVPTVRFAPDPRSHDFPFCAAARAAGFSLWVEPRARTAHYYHGEGKGPLR